MWRARRAPFAVLVGLLHAGLVLALLLQRMVPAVPSDDPALVALDIGQAANAEAMVPELPVQLQQHTLELALPETRYPSESEPAAVTTTPLPALAPASPQSAPGEQLRLVSGADYLRPLDLNYPRAAKRRRAQGMVLVYVFIDSQGMPRDVRLYRSSGDSDLDAAAVRAVGRALFRPRSVNGVPESTQAVVPVNFHLTEPR